MISRGVSSPCTSTEAPPRGRLRCSHHLIFQYFEQEEPMEKQQPQPLCSIGPVQAIEPSDLSGIWDVGEGRSYQKQGRVPGLVSPGDEMNADRLWYKKTVQLKEGDWTRASLLLKGARFNPTVYVDGIKVSQKKGGMAPLEILLDHAAVTPGKTITIEIALDSLETMDESNASYIPKADHWRSCVASCLWDQVLLKYHGEQKFDRIYPVTHFDIDQLSVKYEIQSLSAFTDGGRMEARLLDQHGNIVAKSSKDIVHPHSELPLPFEGQVANWSPDTPHLYHLEVDLFDGDRWVDGFKSVYGKKKFVVRGKDFYLNNKRVTARAVSVVWPRWIRDPEGAALGWNEEWFEKNIVLRMKDHGANVLRFHLGNPPESFIELCNQHGLLVQYEWCFFHSMPASYESLVEQWRPWIDHGIKHPSVAIIHPYNETEHDELAVAWDALHEIVPDYHEFALEDRDQLHVHKYWWSLFENVGLYHESRDEFPKAIMVDEFGGNYLDGENEMGGYPMVRTGFERFLGPGTTKESRSYHHVRSNVKISEYWRRLGAAGFSPFVALGSHEDGSHWFEGPLSEGKPKAVWEALTVAYSPVSVSMDIWDRNFTPEQVVTIPLHVFNETLQSYRCEISCEVFKDGQRVDQQRFMVEMEANGHLVRDVVVNMGAEQGEYSIKATLLNPPEEIKYPVVSLWDVQVVSPKLSRELQNFIVACAEDEVELRTFLAKQGVVVVDLKDSSADVLLGSQSTWEKLRSGELELHRTLEEQLEKGQSVVLLDIGGRYLGQGYMSTEESLKYIQGRPEVEGAKGQEIQLPKGVKVKVKTAPEPESHLHPSSHGRSLWENLPLASTHMWNGTKGGLIVPSADMDLTGLNSEAFLKNWKGRGADVKKIQSGPYWAYELEGYYMFSEEGNDTALQKKLRKHVEFLVEDAPALKFSVNVHADIKIHDLRDSYLQSHGGEATSLIPLAIAGPNLVRVPVSKIIFSEKDGDLYLSQLLTRGRLAQVSGAEAHDEKLDPAAQQWVLNLLHSAAQK